MKTTTFGIRVKKEINNELKKIRQDSPSFNEDFEELVIGHLFSLDYLNSKKQDYQNKVNQIGKLIQERKTRKETYLKSLSKEELKELKDYVKQITSYLILKKVWERKKGINLPFTFYIDIWGEYKDGKY